MSLERTHIKLVKLAILSAFLLGNAWKTNAQETDYKAYTLFVYNFIKYIEWPPESQNKGEFIVGIVGESPVIKELTALSATKKAKGRTIVIKKIAAGQETSYCHLLYICSPKSNTMKTFLPLIKGKPTLVVAEREGLAKKGADISFVTMEDDVLKFEVNKKNLEEHNLKIPNVLSSLGLIVN